MLNQVMKALCLSLLVCFAIVACDHSSPREEEPPSSLVVETSPAVPVSTEESLKTEADLLLSVRVSSLKYGIPIPQTPVLDDSFSHSYTPYELYGKTHWEDPSRFESTWFQITVRALSPTGEVLTETKHEVKAIVTEPGSPVNIRVLKLTESLIPQGLGEETASLEIEITAENQVMSQLKTMQQKVGLTGYKIRYSVNEIKKHFNSGKARTYTPETLSAPTSDSQATISFSLTFTKMSAEIWEEKKVLQSTIKEELRSNYWNWIWAIAKASASE